MSKKNGRRHFQGRPATHKPAPQAQQVQVGTVNGRVAIRFGQAVKLIAFDPPQALQLAEMLAKHAAATVTTPPDSPACGRCAATRARVGCCAAGAGPR